MRFLPRGFLGLRTRVGLVAGLLALGMLSASAGVQAQPNTAGDIRTASVPPIKALAGVQVQNLSSSQTANVQIAYYNQDGSLAQAASGMQNPQSLQIPAGQSQTVFGNTMAVATGFNGSAVVSSDQPVAAITNLLTTDSTGANAGNEAYDGVGAPSSPANVPLLQFNNGQNAQTNSTLTIQNASTNATTVTVTLAAASSTYPSITTKQSSYSLAASGSVSLSLSDLNGLASGQRWVGSAVVSSTGNTPLAVEVNQSDAFHNELLAYDGSGAGSSFVYAPLIETNHSKTYDYFTGFQVQNTNASASETVYLYLNTIPSSCGAAGYVDTQSLNPGASYTWFPVPGTTSVPDFLGSATACTPSGTLIGVVNEVTGASAQIQNQGSTYQAFNDIAATAAVAMPLVENNHSGYYTGQQIQYVGQGSQTVYIYQGGVPSTGCGTGSPSASTALSSGQSVTWFPLPGLAQGPAVSATACVASGSIVGIVHEIVPSAAGDNSFAYEGFNLSP